MKIYSILTKNLPNIKLLSFRSFAKPIYPKMKDEHRNAVLV